MKKHPYLIGICDDDDVYRNRLSRAVRIMCEQMQVLAVIKTYLSGESVLAERDALDILFLDEELAADGHGLNGRDVREWLERGNMRTLIICVTSYEKYMRDSFGANVMGFVTKGSLEESQRIVSAFRRCMEKLAPETKIAYIEAQGHNTRIIYTDGRENVIGCGINMAEEQCKSEKNMVRCQRSYIVNLESVENVIGNFDKFVLKDGTEISISRSKKQEMKSAYLQFKEQRMMNLFGDE